MALPLSSVVPMYNCNCCACRPLNVTSFLSAANSSHDLSSFFTSPVASPSEALRAKWRLVTDSCGYDITYHIGGLLSDGRLDPGSGSLPPGVTGWDATTKHFVSALSYNEGIVLQVGCPGDGYDGFAWLDRPCVPGASGSPGFDLGGMALG